MFSSIVVLPADLTCQLLVKHMDRSTKAADDVVDALREAIEQDKKPDNSLVVAKTGDSYGVFVERNDVIFLGVTREEVS